MISLLLLAYQKIWLSRTAEQDSTDLGKMRGTKTVVSNFKSQDCQLPKNPWEKNNSAWSLLFCGNDQYYPWSSCSQGVSEH